MLPVGVVYVLEQSVKKKNNYFNIYVLQITYFGYFCINKLILVACLIHKNVVRELK